MAPNIVNTSVDIGSVALKNEQLRDETLTFTGAVTVKAGTLLARRKVATAVAASAVTGTGNGTVTAASVMAGPTVPQVGVYTLKVVRAVTNGGEWQLADPNGMIHATDLVMTIGASAATVFKAAGLQFTITDGSTDFALGDTATLTVAADGTLTPFSPTGVGGAQIPIEVLTYDVTSTGAGGIPIRALVSGEVNKNRLIIDADGNGTNITNAMLDQLRAASIIPVDVQQLSS